MVMQLVDIVGPIAIITLVGFLMGRFAAGIDTRSLSTLVIMVATPALIFYTLTSLQVAPETVSVMAGAALLSILVCGGIAFIVLKWVGGPVRSFLPPLMLPNSGNLGLPLVLLAFGEEGMQLGVAYFFVISLVQHSVGMSIYAGVLRLSILARQPMLYAVIAVLVVTLTGIEVPNLVMNTTRILSGLMVPAMLLLLGMSLATLKVSDLKPALTVALGRLALGVISASVVIWTFGFSGVAAGTVFLMATMPTAIVNYILAERFQHNPQQVSGAVVVSTLLTLICLPVLVWIALELSGAEAAMPETATQTHAVATLT